MEDAAGFFANVFGGERFRDYVSTLFCLSLATKSATSLSLQVCSALSTAEPLPTDGDPFARPSY